VRPVIGITSSTLADERGPTTTVNRPYVDAVVAAGGLPVVLPVLDPSAVEEVLATIDGLLVSGGGDVDPAAYGAEAVPEVYGVDPARDAWELALVRHARVPVLGVCRGAQVLNVAAGGTLVLHLPEVSDPGHRARERRGEIVHAVEITDGSRLHAITCATNIGVNTLHHQAVDRVGDGYVVTARAPDGVVEAIEPDDERPVLGVQWHPELLAGIEVHAALFRWLVERSAPATGVRQRPRTGTAAHTSRSA
jgi:putative glutamine amidotransferase